MTPRSGEELIELEARQEPRLVKALEMVAPGSAVREGIDNIVHARTGGLIVIGDPDELAFLFSGGIKLDMDYSPAILYQLAKMDGAIALNGSATKIAWCNVQLMPDPTILSSESGTRHRTAERVSKQTDALVIAVSQRRDVVSLYVDGVKYILEDIPAVLAKANQALATLDKYRSRLDQVSTRLTALEFEGGVTLHDVLTVLQRARRHRPARAPGPTRLRAAGGAARLRPQGQHARLSRLAPRLPHPGPHPAAPEAGGPEHRPRVPRAGRDPCRDGPRAGVGRRRRRDQGEGHPRGPSPSSGDQPRGSLPTDMNRTVFRQSDAP